MTEAIGPLLVDLCNDILPFYLSEAQIEEYPYATYELSISYFTNKDGVYKITADAYIRVYADDGDVALDKADLIMAALDSYMASQSYDGQFVLQHESTTQSCTENVWLVEMQYFVKQLR